MCCEVQDAVFGEAASVGEVFERRLGGAGTKQDFALRHAEPPADLAQLIGRLRQRRPTANLLDVGLAAAEQLGKARQWPGGS